MLAVLAGVVVDMLLWSKSLAATKDDVDDAVTFKPFSYRIHFSFSNYLVTRLIYKNSPVKTLCKDDLSYIAQLKRQISKKLLSSPLPLSQK